MNVSTMEFVVFDVETTGLSPLNGDRILEIAALRVKGNKILDEFTSLINPRRDIPIEAQRVHNITPDMIADAPFAEDVLPDLVDFIGGATLAGHNVKFDLDFVCYELASFGRKLNDATPAFDTLKMSKRLVSHLRSHKLSYLAHSFGIPIDETHRALADVKLTINVLYRLLDIAKDQGIISIPELISLFNVVKPKFQITDTSNSAMLF